ncbi:SH3 domain-containing protein [Streptomyces iconiensis]|uniref:SH3 domain-containing protein n=1 Tax=Streptomyces iconiensis TaxID=1384038 RepID=A0ABT7A1B0_9ACTN|nr:SH3 domain-containing protein [Streptomyces iconiensis]MDJ1134862.1 SH3 domain-containing protein [Streptomyces iconiensis]
MAQLKKGLRKTGAAAVGAAAVLGLTLTLAPGVANAAPNQAAQQAVRVDRVCTVIDNGVNYRGGPGPQYPVLGKVNRGQKLNLKGVQGNWVHGDLWGGRTGIWIHKAYVRC